jgi:predicted TIM-barrel fold metal-dependent hydrolase/GNAT superfamily N-acetyltransferase
MRIIDVHIHVGHRFEWTEKAKEFWMDTGSYVPELFDSDDNQMSEQYGDVIKREGVFAGILIPEYSPLTAGVMPFERAAEIHWWHPELVPVANINPNYHEDPMAAFETQLEKGAKGLKIHPIHGLFYANDERLYPLYEKCRQKGLPVMFHAGTSPIKGSKMRYSDPYTFDDVISDFPDMKVVLCHGGRGFWYQVAEFMAERFDQVYIDVSGLPPQNLLQYYPSMEKNARKYLFGTDFPGVPGIRRNFDAIRHLLSDDAVTEAIGFTNAYDLFGFWNRGIFEARDSEEIFPVVNDASQRYKGVIPEDRYHEPYMPMEELLGEMRRMRFYGYREDLRLLGVMGMERIKDVTLIRHAYVLMETQGKGIGSQLLKFIEERVGTEYLLIGTWQAATWAIEFYKKHGYQLMPDKNDLLRTYWDIPDRQIETSCVLGKRLR